MLKQLSIILSVGLLAGCANMTPTQEGAVAGGLAGGVIGAAVSHGSATWKGAAIGAGIGAVAGAALGSATHRGSAPCDTVPCAQMPSEPMRRHKTTEK